MQNFNKVLCGFPAGRLKAFRYSVTDKTFFIAGGGGFLKAFIVHSAEGVPFHMHFELLV
jgi:hypothetical protein